MKENSFELHIVSFTIPFPADYGGAIDVFYRIKALHQLGVKIHLHCFQYNRKPAAELQKYCENVFYYKRKRGILTFLTPLPYIVASRMSQKLLSRLEGISAPILFEGEHTTAWLDHSRLKGRKKFIRLHNIEHQYYSYLAEESSSFFHKIYYWSESLKLQKYQKKLSAATGLLPISSSETSLFKQLNDRCNWLPAFHAEIKKKEGTSDKNAYLYHGDLTIVINQKVVNSIVKVFKDRNETLSIAGKMEDPYISEFKDQYPWVSLLPNPSADEMEKVILESENHLIFSEHAQGVKLKLIHSLFSGARVLANKKAVQGSKLEKCVHLVELDNLNNALDQLPKLEFGHGLVYNLLDKHYNNEKNAQKLLKIIFDQ